MKKDKKKDIIEETSPLADYRKPEEKKTLSLERATRHGTMFVVDEGNIEGLLAKQNFAKYDFVLFKVLKEGVVGTLMSRGKDMQKRGVGRVIVRSVDYDRYGSIIDVYFTPSRLMVEGWVFLS